MKGLFTRVLAATMLLHGWWTFIQLPRTLFIVIGALRPGGRGIADGDFWAFGSVDAGFRPWYTKIARDYQTQGRFGFAWDDGLGTPLGARIYNNLITYSLLGWLGTRKLCLAGYMTMVIVAGIAAASRFGWWVGIVIALTVAASPLIVGSYTHLGKPEVLWWGVGIIVVEMAFAGRMLEAGVLWSALAVVNLPVSVVLAAFAGPGTVTVAVTTDATGALLVGLLPGLVKHGVRALGMWRSGFMGKLTSEQARLWKRPWYPVRRELVWWVPFVLSIALSSRATQDFVLAAAVVGPMLAFYWANFRLIYMNDAQSLHLGLWVTAFGYALAHGSGSGILAILLLLYNRPKLCGVPEPPEARGAGLSMAKVAGEMRAFPGIRPIPLPQPAALMDFFRRIPNGARILVESDGDPRTESRFRQFLQWTEEFLPQRQIDVANEIHTRFVEPELVDRYLSRFNAQQMALEEMLRLIEGLGASHVITCTTATTDLLEGSRFEVVTAVDTEELSQFRKIVPVPDGTLRLLHDPRRSSVISPATRWHRCGNTLTWEGRAGIAYVIKYRFNPRFAASQDGKALPVQATCPFEDLPLAFMCVEARVDGLICLTFHPQII